MLKKFVILGLPLSLAMAGALQALEVSGAQVAERTEKVLKTIPWAASLSDAKDRAQREKKLVFWLQLVGDLDGGL